MSTFKEITPLEWDDNAFQKIGSEWMLITVGNEQKQNMMTASWGGIGVLWNKNVTFAFVRPSRYSYGFMEENDSYALCFFGKDYRDALNFCGTKSGRDVDKIKETGLTVAFSNGVPYFEEAKVVVICKKQYVQDMDPKGFLNEAILPACYANGDFHRVYVGEIEKILIKEC